MFWTKKSKIQKLLYLARKIKGHPFSLNIYRVNGQVAIQIFGYEYTKDWTHNLSVDGSSGLVYFLAFNQAKTNNEQNLLRFKKSIFFNSYESISDGTKDSYAKFYPSRENRKFYIKM